MKYDVSADYTPEAILRTIILETIGAASVMWEGVPHGNFLSEDAVRLGDECIEALNDWGLLT